MRVHPACQRQGLGQAIMNALEKRALEMGYSKLCLDTTTKQIPAQRLAEKNGFEKIGTRKVRSLELILYEKTLTRPGRKNLVSKDSLSPASISNLAAPLA